MWRESSKRHFFYSFCCASLLGVVAAAAAPNDAQQSSSPPEPEPWFSFGFKFYLLNASMWAIACYFIYQQFQRLFGTLDSSSSSPSSASAAIAKPTTSTKPSSTTQIKEEESDLAAKVESLVATLKQKSIATEKDEKRQQKLVSALQSLRATTDSALRTLSVDVKEEADKEKVEEKQRQQSQQTKGEQKEQEKEKEKDERRTEKEYYDEEEGDDEDDDGEDDDEDDEDDDDEDGEGSSLESSMGERSDLGYIPDTSKSGAGATGGKARGRNRVPSAKRRRRRWRRKQRLPNEENGVSSLGATAKGAGVVGVRPEEEGASASEEISDDVERSGLVVPPRLKKKGLRRRRNVAKKGTIGGRGQDEGEADSEGTRTNSGDADSDNDVVNNDRDNGDTGTSSATLSMMEREETLKALQLPDEEADLSSTADDFSSLRASLDGLNFSGGWSLIEKDSTASKDEPNDKEKKETSDESNDDSRNNDELRSLKESLLSFEKSDDEGDSTAPQDSSLDSLKAQLGDFPSFDSLSLGQAKEEEDEEGEGENALPAPFSLGGLEEGGGGGMFDDAFEQLLKAKQQANKTSVKNVADEIGVSIKDGVKQTNFSKREEGALLRDWAVKEDENKAGLRKAKKTPMAFGSKSKKQSMMEDAHTIHIPFFGDASQGLVAVLDGHAGPNAAQAACSLLPKELETKLMEATMANGGGYPNQDLSAVMVAAFTAADRQMEEFEFEGCTATAVFMWHTADGDRYLQAANVGDSAAFLRHNGQAVKLTYDHKVTDSRERERMTSEGVEITPGKTRISGLAVSRALGDHFVKQNKLGMTAIPHVSPGVQLTDDDDILIVASDGLWDVIDGQAAMDLIKDLPNAEAMAEQLMSRALGDPACKDNVTIIVVLL